MPTTSNPQVKIVNVETGEEIVRDANTQELSQIKADEEEAANRASTAAQKAEDRAALLAQLGITEEQAKLLLG